MVELPKLAAMPTERQCPDCGAVLSDSAPAGLCPRCLFESAQDFSDAEQHESFAGYELLEPIAHGGMGIVYKARQISVNRTVALKMLHGGQFATRNHIQRFRVEATAAASLQHPNIVAVHEVGFAEGQHFIAMDHVQGLTLAQHTAKGPIEPERTATYLRYVAAAIHYAHERNILHRDLQPANILIDSATDQPRITDFGLAKQLDSTNDLTLSGQVLGSPAYVAPEQAAGIRAQVTGRSDIYSLGAILYQCLTGRPPFQGASLPDILNQVRDTDPVQPRKLLPAIPRDLETICLKCLEKDPAKRYPTAQALADDLQRFLNNEPITARPITRTARVIRWSQRNPALATAYSLLILLLLLILIASPIAIFRINEARKSEAAEALRARRSEYGADMLLAGEAWTAKNLGRTRQILEKHRPNGSDRDLRGWEWRYLWDQTRSDELFTLATNSSSYRSVAWSPDLQLIASLGQESIRNDSTEIELWDVASRQLRQKFVVPGIARQVRFLPNGEIAAASGSQDQSMIFVWNSRTQTSKEIPSGADSLGAIELNRDGTVLAATGKDWVAAWDVTTGGKIAQVDQPTFFVNNTRTIALSPDGRYIAYNSFAGTHANSSVVLVDVKTGSRIGKFRDHKDQIFSLVFSPDNQTLASASFDGVVILWKVETGEVQTKITAHPSGVSTLAFSPDGELLATGGWDQQIMLWNSRSGANLGALQGHYLGINSIAFSPHQENICSGSNDGTLRVWPTKFTPKPPESKFNSPLVFGTQFAPTADVFQTFDGEDRVTIWDPTNLVARSSFRIPDDAGTVVTHSPGCQFNAVQLTNNHVAIFRIYPFEEVQTLSDSTNSVSQLAFSLDGELLAIARTAAHGRNSVTIYRWSSHSPLGHLDLRGPSVTTIRFSPRSELVALGFADGLVEVWQWPARRLIATFDGHLKGVNRLLFLADQRRLVSLSSGGGDIKIWDLISRSNVATLSGQLSAFNQLTESRDGRRLAAGGNDGTITIWDLASYQEVARLRGHRDSVFTLGFLPDGDTLTSVSRGSMHVWRAARFSETDKK